MSILLLLTNPWVGTRTRSTVKILGFLPMSQVCNYMFIFYMLSMWKCLFDGCMRCMLCFVAHKAIILQDKVHYLSSVNLISLNSVFVFCLLLRGETKRVKHLSCTTIQKKSCLVYSTKKAYDSHPKKNKTKQIRIIHKTKQEHTVKHTVEIEFSLDFCMFSLNTCFFRQLLKLLKW